MTRASTWGQGHMWLQFSSAFCLVKGRRQRVVTPTVHRTQSNVDFEVHYWTSSSRGITQLCMTHQSCFIKCGVSVMFSCTEELCEVLCHLFQMYYTQCYFVLLIILFCLYASLRDSLGILQHISFLFVISKGVNLSQWTFVIALSNVSHTWLNST